MELLDIQRKNLTTWATLMEKWGVQFKIILPDGTEYGALEVVVPKARTRRPGMYPFGALQAYFKPMVEKMTAGDVVQVPCGEFDPERLRGAISAWTTTNWGKGGASTYTNKDKHAIEVMRIN
jgi:hypothetical protein